MGYKPFGTNDPETVKHWSTMVDVRFEHGTSFKEGEAVGTEPGAAPILRKTDLESTKTKGDRVRVTTVDNFEGEGVVGDEIIVGKGEAVRDSNVDVVIDQIRHEAESGGNMSEKRTVIDFRKTGRGNLASWIRKKIDALRLVVMSGEIGVGAYKRVRWTSTQIAKYLGANLVAPDGAHHLFAGANFTADAGGSVGGLSNTDVPTARLLAKIRRYISDMDNPPQPLDVNGEEYYVLYLDEAIIQLLEQDTEFREMYKDAAPRAKENPLISGRYTMAKGFIIRKIPQLIKPAGATTPGAVRRMLVAGADDLLEAFAKPEGAEDGRFSWIEETGDRKARKTITVGTMYGAVKNTWTDPDSGDVAWRNSLAVDVWVGAA